MSLSLTNLSSLKPSRFHTNKVSKETANGPHSFMLKREKKGLKRPSSVSEDLLDPRTQMSPVKSNIFCPSTTRAVWPLSSFTFTTCSQQKILEIQQRLSQSGDSVSALLCKDSISSDLVLGNTANAIKVTLKR